MKYTTKQIEEAAKKLRKLSAVEEQAHTAKKAVQMLEGELGTLLARGYSLEKVGRALRSAGIEVSPLTLREYLRTASRASSPSKRAPSASAPKRKVAKRKASVSKASSAPVKAQPATRKKPPTPAKVAKAKPAAPKPAPPPNPVFQRGNLALAKATFQVRPDTPDSDL